MSKELSREEKRAVREAKNGKVLNESEPFCMVHYKGTKHFFQDGKVFNDPTKKLMS